MRGSIKKYLRYSPNKMGDMLFFRALFTKEANAEAEELIWKKSNFFFSDGSLSRGISTIGKDCLMGLYQLTKD